MSVAALEREIKFNIGLFVKMARRAQRDRKRFSAMPDYYIGVRNTYMVCARSLKGCETQAKVVNAILRTVGV